MLILFAECVALSTQCTRINVDVVEHDDMAMSFRCSDLLGKLLSLLVLDTKKVETFLCTELLALSVRDSMSILIASKFNSNFAHITLLY